jgi:hypothetical protein
VRVDWTDAALAYVRGGHAPQVAAAMCGVSAQALSARRRTDKAFNDAIARAVDQAEGDLLEKVKAGDQNARWILERRFWSRWSLKIATRRSEDAARMLDAAERVLPIELYEQLLEELRRSEAAADIEDATDPATAPELTEDAADDQVEARHGARAQLPR